MRSSKVKNSTAKWNSYLIDIFKCRLWFLSIEVDGPALLQVQQLLQPLVQLILTVIKTSKTQKKVIIGLPYRYPVPFPSQNSQLSQDTK
jgi:hypothetical protein